MSQGKPPPLPKKTLLGMPNDMREAIAQLRRKEGTQASKPRQSSSGAPRSGAPQPGSPRPGSPQPGAPRAPQPQPQPAPGLQRTLYGNPHAQPTAAGRAPARPQLPQERPFQPPAPAARPGLGSRAQPAPQAPASQRTLLGSAADFVPGRPNSPPPLAARPGIATGNSSAPAAQPTIVQPSAPGWSGRRPTASPAPGAPRPSGHGAAGATSAPVQPALSRDASGPVSAQPPPLGRAQPRAQPTAAPVWPLPEQQVKAWPAHAAAEPALQPQVASSTPRSGVHPSGTTGHDQPPHHAPVGSAAAPARGQPSDAIALGSTEPDRASARAAAQPSQGAQAPVHSARAVPVAAGAAGLPGTGASALPGHAHEPSAGAAEPGEASSPMLATRVVSAEEGARAARALMGTSRRSGERSQAGFVGLPSQTLPAAVSADSLSLGLSTDAQPGRPQVKRWPALSLLGFAVVAAFAVVAIRAPALLPAPLAGWFGAHAAQAPTAQSVSAATDAPREPSPAAGPGESVASAGPGQAPAQSAVNGEQPTGQAPDVSRGRPAEGTPEATQPASAEPASGPQPSAATAAAQEPGATSEASAQPAVAAPRMLQGQAADLEKRAIDLLVANDYPAARAVYEQLRNLEPSRPEYAIMLDLLAREAEPACGEPGQPPCPVR